MHANIFLTNLALVLCVAAVTTVVFERLRQPVVLGYLIILWASQYTSWFGPFSLMVQHAFMVPVPFLGV